MGVDITVGERITGVADIPDSAIWLSGRGARALAVQTAELVLASKFRPTRLVMLARGGLAPADIIARRLHIPTPHILNMGLSRYGEGTDESSMTFKEGQMPGVEGQNCLLVDDIWDKGWTGMEAKRRLHLLGAAAVEVATPIFKPERNQTNEVPDYYAMITKEWVVFPSERYDEPVYSELLAKYPHLVDAEIDIPAMV